VDLRCRDQQRRDREEEPEQDELIVRAEMHGLTLCVVRIRQNASMPEVWKGSRCPIR
jgi:hypothetical protein